MKIQDHSSPQNFFSQQYMSMFNWSNWKYSKDTYVHTDTSYSWPWVTFSFIFEVCSTGFQDWFVDTTTTSNNTFKKIIKIKFSLKYFINQLLCSDSWVYNNSTLCFLIKLKDLWSHSSSHNWFQKIILKKFISVKI